jgi:hypothetical protein
MVCATFLATVTACCASPTKPSLGTTAGSWSNEPRGFAAVTDHPWSSVTGGAWNRRPSPHDRITTDDTAPQSPSDVLEYVYPAGFTGGSAPATHYFPLENRKDIFIGLLWKVSDRWQGHASEVNKIQFIYLHGPADVAMVMHGATGGPYEIRVLPQWPEHTASWLTPNVTNRSVTLGQWHRVEWYLKYESQYGAGDGIIRWWLDGALLGDYTNVRYPNDAGFVEYQMSPTWGGIGDTKRRADFFRFDHTYISAPSGAAALRPAAGSTLILRTATANASSVYNISE